MKKKHPFPYPEGFGELEVVGFVFTDLERELAFNPSFQQLRNHGFPRWGELTTGLRYKNDSGHARFQSVPMLKSRNAAHNQAVEFLKTMTQAICRAYKVRGSYEGTDRLTGYFESEPDADVRLLHDITRWLDHPDDDRWKGFRWEEAWTDRQEWNKYRGWEAQRDAFRTDGQSSSLVVLLLPDVPYARREDLYAQVIAGCVHHLEQLGQPFDGDRHSLIRHVPLTYCQDCQISNWHDRNGLNRPTPEHSNAIPVIDCGDAKSIRAWVRDRGLRRYIKAVNFTISHADFDHSLKDGSLYAELSILDLSGLAPPTRKMVKRHVEEWLVRQREEEVLRNIQNAEKYPDNPRYQHSAWAETRVLEPDTPPMNCLVVAGPCGGSSRDLLRQAFTPKEIRHLLEDGLSITATHST